MLRYLSLAVISFGGLALAAPQVSRAQVPLGVQVQVGPGSLSYQQGYPYVAPGYVVPAPVYVGPRVVVGGPLLSPWYGPGYRGYWGGYRGYGYGPYRHERWEHRGFRH